MKYWTEHTPLFMQVEEEFWTSELLQWTSEMTHLKSQQQKQQHQQPQQQQPFCCYLWLIDSWNLIRIINHVLLLYM
jgi:hypothetical protein